MKYNIDPKSLSLNPDRPYAFKSPLKTFFVQVVDFVGMLLFKPSQKPIQWQSMTKIGILRLDQLGDVILALPTLEALSEFLPNTQIDFIVDAGAKELVEMSRLRINVQVFHAPWLAKSKSKWGFVKSVKSLTDFFRKGHYDAVIDLRGDFRHILAMKWSGVPIRIGRTLTGGGFWLTHPVVRQSGLHEVDQNLDLLKKVGIVISDKERTPKLFPPELDNSMWVQIRSSLELNWPVVAIHATCTASAKWWPVSYWCRLIESLPDHLNVIILGAESEKNDIEKIAGECKRKVTVAAGVFRLPELGAILKQCELFIGVDSGPAHIAASVGAPVISIFSGTNLAAQWAPRGRQVSLFQKKVSCSPCEEAECPLGNECMNLITVDEVLSRVNYLLDKRNA
jgi:heptosyltransferase-2